MAELIGRAAVGERAAGRQIGQHDGALGVQDLGHLGHEVHAAERDHVGVGLLRGAREAEAVADVIGEVLDLRLLVVVRQDDGVALLLQALDLLLELPGGRQSRF